MSAGTLLLRAAPRRDLQARPAVAPQPDFDVLAFGAHDYAHHGLAPAGADWSALQASFAELPVDRYLPGGASYRRRRFGRYRLDLSAAKLHDLPDRPFFQSADVNRVAGGIQRHFAPLAAATRHNRVLQRLIRFHAARLHAVRPEVAAWKVYVHQIRIVASAGHSGKPAPEGLHQDGHHYVAQVLVARHNVAGAESRVFDAHGRLVLGRTLTRPLDSLLVNDRSVFHEASDLHCLSDDAPAWRDMLLIDFNPHDDADEN